MMTAKRLATSLCVAAVFSVGALASESPVLERIVASGKIRIGKKKPFSSPGTACARRKSACCLGRHGVVVVHGIAATVLG